MVLCSWWMKFKGTLSRVPSMSTKINFEKIREQNQRDWIWHRRGYSRLGTSRMNSSGCSLHIHDNGNCQRSSPLSSKFSSLFKYYFAIRESGAILFTFRHFVAPGPHTRIWCTAVTYNHAVRDSDPLSSVVQSFDNDVHSHGLVRRTIHLGLEQPIHVHYFIYLKLVILAVRVRSRIWSGVQREFTFKVNVEVKVNSWRDGSGMNKGDRFGKNELFEKTWNTLIFKSVQKLFNWFQNDRNQRVELLYNMLVFVLIYESLRMSRIPLVPRRPKSGETACGKDKKDKRSSQRRDKADNQSETPVLPSDHDERVRNMNLSGGKLIKYYFTILQTVITHD